MSLMMLMLLMFVVVLVCMVSVGVGVWFLVYGIRCTVYVVRSAVCGVGVELELVI